jgi:hypothetical protein
MSIFISAPDRAHVSGEMRLDIDAAEVRRSLRDGAEPRNYCPDNSPLPTCERWTSLSVER